MALDYLAQSQNIAFEEKKLAYRAEFIWQNKKIILIKPTTYMNRSGQALKFWQEEEKIPLSQILVITDDIALPFGKLRVKGKGSSGGHNGLSNIEKLLETSKYPRLKFGIGDDYPAGMQVEYVLNPFFPEEKEKLPELLKISSELILVFCGKGIIEVMNRFNKIDLSKKEKKEEETTPKVEKDKKEVVEKEVLEKEVLEKEIVEKKVGLEEPEEKKEKKRWWQWWRK